MAGGMGRKGERISLHERVHGTKPPLSDRQQIHLSESPTVKHCWVTDEHGRQPALLLEWRRVAAGWQGRVVRPVLDGGGWIVVEEWLAAERLEPTKGLR